MASKRTDYSIQLPDINAPVKGAAGDLYEQAGRTQASANATRGQAKAMDIQADTGMLTFLGTNAIAAGKGYLESNEATEIKDTIDNTEGIGKKPQEAADLAARFPYEQAAIGNVMKSMGMDYTPGMMAMSEEADKIQKAQQQGFFSKEEALLRMGSIVKKYSAMMPGWASDFRKVAAELTGLNNLDTMAVHNFFTQKTAKEKQAEALQAAELQLTKDVAAFHGIQISELTPAHRASYQSFKQTQIALQRMENQLKMGNLSQEEGDKRLGQIVMLDVASQVAGMNADLVRLGAFSENPQEFLNGSKTALQLSTKIEMAHSAVAQRIRELVKPDPNRPALSFKAANELLDRVKKDFDVWREGVKTVEGRSMFIAAVKKAENDVTLMLSNLQLASPLMAGLSKFGVAPEIIKAYFAIGDEKEFDRRFPGLAPSIKAILNPQGMQMFAGVNNAVLGGGSVDLKNVAQMSPELAVASMGSAIADVMEWQKEANPNPQQQLNYTRNLAHVGSNLNFSVPKDIDTASKIVGSPDFKAYLAKMPVEQRVTAVTPLLTQAEKATRTMTSAVQEELAKWNTDEGNKAATLGGWRLNVVQDPLTRELKALPEKVGPTQKFGVSDVGTFRLGNRQLDTSAAGLTPNAREAQRRVQTLLDQLNRTGRVYFDAADTAGLVKGDVVQFKDRLFGIVKGDTKESLSDAFTKQLEKGTDVPKNVTPAPDPMVDALGMAESGGKADAVGDGGKAVGTYQMHPEAMAEVGFKPEDRKDPVKAKQAAAAYLGKQLQTYNGDIFKAIAAWNMGPAEFAAHYQKHGELWLLEAPAATQGLIRRFKQHYKAN